MALDGVRDVTAGVIHRFDLFSPRTRAASLARSHAHVIAVPVPVPAAAAAAPADDARDDARV